MTTLREAASLALEALEYGQHTLTQISENQWESRGQLAMQALKAALTEPVQESKYIQHGWLCPSCGAGNSPMNMRCGCKGWPKMEITC